MKEYQAIGIKHPVIKEIKNSKKKNNREVMIIEDLSMLALIDKYKFKVLQFIFCNDRIYSEDAKEIRDQYLQTSNESYEVSVKTYDTISEKDNSAGMIAVIKLDKLSLDNIDPNKYPFILVLDGLEIPGNVGTIYRTADAVGIDLIINVDLKTSIYNPKTIASSRGMCLTMPFINTDYETANKFLLANNYRILLGEPEEGQAYSKVNYDGHIAIVMGSERFGINKNWYNYQHERIFIPMVGEMKSLNVGVATSIILYEAKNKRS